MCHACDPEMGKFDPCPGEELTGRQQHDQGDVKVRLDPLTRCLCCGALRLGPHREHCPVARTRVDIAGRDPRTFAMIGGMING